MKRTRTYYEKRFANYPDLVDLITFRQMLGGIGDTFARRLVKENRVKHFFIKMCVCVCVCVSDICSTHEHFNMERYTHCLGL